jgi:hypothetical protein
MANLLRFLIFVFLFFPALASAQVWTGTGPAPAGYIDLAGWIKNADGTSSRAFTDGNGTRATPTNNTVSVTSNALVNTSKGQHLMQITKTAAVDIPRVGSAVVGLMKQVGPVGMSVAAVSLVCELTDICNDAGNWVLQQIDFGGTASGHYPTCEDAIGLSGQTFPNCTQMQAAHPSAVWFRSPSTPPASANCINNGGVSWTYTAIAYTCSNPPKTSEPATEANLDSKAPLLNDERLVPELQDKKRDIPTGIPTLTPGQKKELGVESTPTKDPQGNITGREDTTTELEPIDAGTADKPGLVIIKETKTTVKYDTNNTQISTTTSTSYSSPPPPDKPPTQYEIKFDGVDPVELPTHNVPNTFASTSWGDGTCPADIELNLNLGHFVIPTTPICDTAEKLNPFVLALSALFSIYIVAGVKASNS